MALAEVRHAPSTSPSSDGFRASLLPASIQAGRWVALAAVGLALVAPAYLDRYQLWILGAGFLIGLPHGAVDHALPVRERWVSGRAALALVAAAYLGLAVATIAAMAFLGGPMVVILVAVSILHFGAGDITAGKVARIGDRSAGPATIATTVLAILDAAACGAPVVAGPFLRWREAITGPFHTLGLTLPSAATTTSVGLGLFALAGVGVIHAVRTQEWDRAVDIVVLSALFLSVTPLAAFGIYFGAWHGLRHTARLLATDPGADRLGTAVRRFVRTAALPAAAALAATVALVWWAARDSLESSVFEILLGLTVPHLLVVFWWDRHPSPPGPRPPTTQAASD